MDAVHRLFARNITPNSAPFIAGSYFAPLGYSARDQSIGWPHTTVSLTYPGVRALRQRCAPKLFERGRSSE